MDRSNQPSSSTTKAASAPFAYQTRLLERTSSRSGSLSRNNSQSSINILTNTSGTSTPTSTRRWTPSHRVSNSLDAVRGKWEERSREAAAEESLHYGTLSAKDAPKSVTPTRTDRLYGQRDSGSASAVPDDSDSPRTTEVMRTPTYLKRRTMPTPIIASPLSPNSTGISVEATTLSSSNPNRIHLPTSFTTSSYSSPSVSALSARPSRSQRSNTIGSTPTQPSLIPSIPWNFLCAQHLPARNPLLPYLHLLILDADPHLFMVLIRSLDLMVKLPEKINSRPSSSTSFLSSNQQKVDDERASPSMSTPISTVMAPAPYRSSYMTNKKASYGGALGEHRRLGRHLPRIASGDAPDDWTPEPEPEPEPELELPKTPIQHKQHILADSYSPTKMSSRRMSAHDLSISAPGSEDVAGLPGRIQLKAPTSSPSSSPLPSSRMWGSSWADKQRQLIHAYEYLCHVGEAQQWIEGCLGEELDFGVVEMEDGLRNGVVLAKLVRVFKGEDIVRKIFEAPKLDFRHSDNINIFFKFVREVGLPEGFIFELTDLYDKKNMPKVIYCIHALSHLLARRGMAERIGNLLGRLHFSDDQLQKTQKGLKESGVAMPNFGSVGRELAKEINELEVEIETEEEKRDRLLLENEGFIKAFQSLARGCMTRKSYQALRGRLRLTEKHICKLQAQCRNILARRTIQEQNIVYAHLLPWVLGLQATVRSALARKAWHSQLQKIKASARYGVKVQAQIRGVLQRRRYSQLKLALRKINISVVRFQAVARAHVTRHPHIGFSVIGLQAFARGVLARGRYNKTMAALIKTTRTWSVLQAHCQAVLMRRRMRTQMAKIENITHVVVRIQAAVRTYLARKRLLILIRGLRKATPVIVGLQARARATIARQHHRNLNKELSEVKTIHSVGALQALARAVIVRNKHQEIQKQLDICSPNMTGFQACCRGALLRRDYRAWRDHLRRSSPVATLLQAMLRGAMQRRTFQAKMDYYHANLSKVVKIQSLFRAKETREQYRQLTLGKNVSVGTIKNFVHLLDDSEADFQEEIKVERLRKRVVEHIRENQSLESEVNDLDVKIALVVQNVKSFEELVKARKGHGIDHTASHAARMSLLAAHGDPFSGHNTADHEARKKLELYQQLFYLLQTRGEYLSRLFVLLSSNEASEAHRRFTERIVLTLFGYGQDHREDFLLLKLFQLSIREEVASSASIEEIARGHPLFINIAVQYIRSKQIIYVQDSFQTIVKEVIEADDLDLEANPSVIHRLRLDLEEMRTGVASSASKDVSFHEALTNPDTRAEYIRHLQKLQLWTEAFVHAMRESTRRMPYGMRYLVRETLFALRERFPGTADEAFTACLGRLVYYRYINPAIITPETFDIVSRTVDVSARKNLSQISKILTQVSSGVEFSDDSPSYVPINDYVRKAISELSSWFIEVADVSDAESHHHAHEFLDATVQPKPIYISPNEIYTVHGLLSQHLDFLAPRHDEPLRIILAELGGVPHIGNDDLKDARDSAITLELTNRFAHVHDLQAEEKTLWVQAKRGVLAILRVQPAQDLLDSLMRSVTEADEMAWEEILEAELETEARQHPRRQPSAAANDSAYRLEDIRSLKFAAVKALAISNLLELERQGKISREDGFQGILNAIAVDVRSKHRKRLQRQQEMENMNAALRQLAERKKYFEEQINSYHSYVEAAMNTMQRGKGKKRFVLPFTKQYFHLRDLQKSGQTPQFGSYLYTAKYLYEKGILLSIDRHSPRQFDKIQLTMSSNTAGIFTLVLESTLLGNASRIASEDIRMEDLLQAKYEKRSSLSLFDGLVKVNFDLFLYQINKKFYV
ncbi:hypothetical protein BDQ17DRAFT_1398182 [Cyathus striatus]|nr:hypothetical protein BDQ17DRAFT_1398182 [Cyathus striatus]